MASGAVPKDKSVEKVIWLEDIYNYLYTQKGNDSVSRARTYPRRRIRRTKTSVSRAGISCEPWEALWYKSGNSSGRAGALSTLSKKNRRFASFGCSQRRVPEHPQAHLHTRSQKVCHERAGAQRAENKARV